MRSILNRSAKGKEPPRRIGIIGSGGSGKSAVARQLGTILGIEVIHLDALFWKPGWVETPKAEWRALQEALVLRETWIMDGNYQGTIAIRLAAADTIVFLDLPRAVCLWRVLGRWLRYRGTARPELAPGCPERLDWAFLRWIWKYPHNNRPALMHLLNDHAQSKTVVILRTPSQARRFLGEIAARGGQGMKSVADA